MELAEFIENASCCMISSLNNKIEAAGLTIEGKSTNCNDSVWDDPTLFRQKRFGYYTWVEVNDLRDDTEKDFGACVDFRLSVLDDLTPNIKGLSARDIMRYIQTCISINLFKYLHGDKQHTHWSDDDIQAYNDKLNSQQRFVKIKVR